MNSLEAQRAAFIRDGGRFLAFPLAGAIDWTAIAVTSRFVPKPQSVYVVLFGTGMIFPVALLIARIAREQIFQPGNRFAALMGSSVLMVNLLWALHLPLAYLLPAIVPLSVALALGLHWIVFGWIIGSPLGLIHALLRTFLCTAAFFLFPAHGLLAVAASVVICYTITMVQLGAFLKSAKPGGRVGAGNPDPA